MGAPCRSPIEEGRAIVEQLGGRWTDRGGMCRCPAHDDRTPSLSVRPGRSRLLLHCFAGCAAPEILRALAGSGILRGTAAEAPGPPPMKRDDRARWAARRIWSEARPIAGTPAERYLAGRGLAAGSPELRYHPRTPLGRGALAQFRPALIAAVRDDDEITGVHRTFIDPSDAALADIAAPKRALGRLGGGAVRLGGIAPRLGLAEGIESALAASSLFDVPCWAVLGTERFRHVRMPAGVAELLLFLDHDPGGRRAERLAREAFAGRAAIHAHYPPQPGDDWNDVLGSSSRG